MNSIGDRGSELARVVLSWAWSFPGGTKPQYMQNELGWEVISLEMRRNGWELSSQVKTVREAIDNDGPFDVLMGSSFGGLAIANAVRGIQKIYEWSS